MEIERKFLLKEIPESLIVSKKIEMVQGYLNRSPVVRVRKENADYVLTYKGGGLMVREEVNLPLDEKSFNNLIGKCDGMIIKKTRHVINLDEKLKAEADVFAGELTGLKLVEVEFETEEEALSFDTPLWFGREVTMDGKYHNSYLSNLRPDSLELKALVAKSME